MTPDAQRLSICYVVPGHDLDPSAGPTWNVLSVAHELGQWADVTVAFGRVVEPVTPTNFTVAEIAPTALRGGMAGAIDAVARGISPRETTRYIRAVHRFAEQHLGQYDIVLEGSWLLTGAVTAWCTHRGIPSIPILSAIPMFQTPWRRPVTA